METWFSALYVARVITAERVQLTKREHTLLNDFNFAWLKPLIRTITGLFL